MNRTAYDGEKNLYSAIPLPTGQFKVELSDSEDLSSQTYAVSIKIMNELKLSKLEDYLSGNVPYVPCDILQGMDVVMKENPSKYRISVDRDCYAPSFKVEDDLKHGIAAHRGFQSTLRPTAQGLALCLDSSVLAFRKPLAVLEYLKEHIPKFDGEYIDSNLSLVQYFWEKYGKEIVYQDIPCLILGRNNRTNHVPMEFCILFEGQRYRKKLLDEVGQEKLKKLCLAWPPARRNAISEMMQAYDGPCGDTTQNFGLQINKNMTCVQGRVIGPPDLKIGAPDGTVDVVRVQNEKRQWNIAESSVVDGKQIERWALIEFSSSGITKLRIKDFIENLRNRSRSLGIYMEEPLICHLTSMREFSSVSRLEELLRALSRKLAEKCCLSTHVNREDDLFLGNICLKINAKLGGINVELTQRLPHFEEENHVMFIGADVNHPVSKKSTTPSIASACLRHLCSEIKESLEWMKFGHQLRAELLGKVLCEAYSIILDSITVTSGNRYLVGVSLKNLLEIMRPGLTGVVSQQSDIFSVLVDGRILNKSTESDNVTDVRRKEEVVARAGIVIEEKNWPPFFPIIHHDIANEIPIHLQKLQYVAFTTLLVHYRNNQQVWEIVYSKDGSVKEILNVMQLKCHKSAVTWLCFSPNSDQIITTSKDGSIRIWNINVLESFSHCMMEYVANCLSRIVILLSYYDVVGVCVIQYLSIDLNTYCDTLRTQSSPCLSVAHIGAVSLSVSLLL
ncbi:hypothetical protein ACS0TY_017843 [Phlomoides rotata]